MASLQTQTFLPIILSGNTQGLSKGETIGKIGLMTTFLATIFAENQLDGASTLNMRGILLGF